MAVTAQHNNPRAYMFHGGSGAPQSYMITCSSTTYNQHAYKTTSVKQFSQAMCKSENSSPSIAVQTTNACRSDQASA
eukprot:1137052-Pelagomonas_calceolata.AAC.1